MRFITILHNSIAVIPLRSFSSIFHRLLTFKVVKLNRDYRRTINYFTYLMKAVYMTQLRGIFRKWRFGNFGVDFCCFVSSS